MIWIGLQRLLVLFLKLWVLPAKPAADPTIDPNQKCPVCGARQGTLRAVWTKPITRTDEETNTTKVVKGDVMVEHTCGVCGARSNHKPVHEDANNLALPVGVQ